jgi:hypothetical protein
MGESFLELEFHPFNIPAGNLPAMNAHLLPLCLSLLTLISLPAAVVSAADEKTEPSTVDFKGKVAQRLESLKKQPALIHSALGVTRQETPVPCVFSADDLNFETDKTRVLLIGGLDGSQTSVDAVIDAVNWFYGSEAAAPLRKQFSLSAAPIANPDGWALRQGPKNASGGDPTTGYPPQGPAYHDAQKPEVQYLWRWIGMHAPDLVVDVRAVVTRGNRERRLGTGCRSEYRGPVEGRTDPCPGSGGLNSREVCVPPPTAEGT